MWFFIFTDVHEVTSRMNCNNTLICSFYELTKVTGLENCGGGRGLWPLVQPATRGRSWWSGLLGAVVSSIDIVQHSAKVCRNVGNQFKKRRSAERESTEGKSSSCSRKNVTKLFIFFAFTRIYYFYFGSLWLDRRRPRWEFAGRL